MAGENPSSRKPLWILIAAFSTALIANGFLVYFALGTWTGLETEQHYVKGLAYNDNLAGAERQQALGWSPRLTTEFTSADGLSGVFRVRFNDGSGAAVNGLDVRVAASRPTHDGYDRTFTATPAGGGVYEGDFSLPLKGQWDFRILAWRGDDHFQHVERIETP